jgi:hypothetical protein
MSFAKHEPKQTKAVKKKAAQPTKAAPTAYEQECMLMGRIPTDLGGIECALADLARHVGNIAQNGYNGENKLAVFTGPAGSGYHPILIALEPSDTMDSLIEVSGRIATAFERIADAMTAKGPGEQG